MRMSIAASLLTGSSYLQLLAKNYNFLANLQLFSKKSERIQIKLFRVVTLGSKTGQKGGTW